MDHFACFSSNGSVHVEEAFIYSTLCFAVTVKNRSKNLTVDMSVHVHVVCFKHL